MTARRCPRASAGRRVEQTQGQCRSVGVSGGLGGAQLAQGAVGFSGPRVPPAVPCPLEDGHRRRIARESDGSWTLAQPDIP
jgi:hypothetical protein